MVVLLRGAHPAAVRPLVEALLEGHAPGDAEAPCVRVCFSPHELLDAPVGARVVLVGAERASEWLNVHRPVVTERELVLLLWVEDGALEHLRRSAPDFLDWVSHRIEVPWFAPAWAVAELGRALGRVNWIAVAGSELVAMTAEGRREIEASRHYDDIASAMDSGDVLVRGLKLDDELWRLMIAHAEVQWRHRVVLAEPDVLPPFVWVIDARIEEWEQSARRLESLGVEHARSFAALGSSSGGASQQPFARALAVDEPHMELLCRVARLQVDPSAVRLAQDLGLDDVSEGLAPTTWSDDPVTPEWIDLSFRGGLRARRALAGHVMSVVEQKAIELGKRSKELSLLPDVVQDVLEQLYREDGRRLRTWHYAYPTFERYVETLVVRVLANRDKRSKRHEAVPLTSNEEPAAELDFDERVEWQQVIAALNNEERELLDHIARGLSTIEIARAYQLPLMAVRSRRHRLMRKLRNLIEENSGRHD
jgi:DNA-directed RNA polymerase specialized sigma24 family protein